MKEVLISGRLVAMADAQNSDGIHHPVWDPPWLRNSFTRCLWDGGLRADGMEFCSDACFEMYSKWDHDLSRQDFGREPVPGRHDELTIVLPIRTPRRPKRGRKPDSLL